MAAASIGGLLGTTFSTFSGLIPALIMIAIAVLMIFGFLFLYRNTKFVYTVLIYRDFGNGKAGFKITKAGKFKKKTTLFGLVDIGGEFEIKCKDGRKIQNISDLDIQDINGKKGYMVMQKPDDPAVLVPITKVKHEGMEMMMAIAPSDLRDVAVGIIKDADREMMSGFEKIMPYVSYIVMGIILFICVMVNIQFAQNMHQQAIDGAVKILREAHTIAQTPVSGAP